MTTTYQGQRVRSPRYRLGTKVRIKGLKGGPYKITKDEYRSYNKKWAYKVDGKWWFETSLRKARSKK